jgi:uncharacterized membrane protein
MNGKSKVWALALLLGVFLLGGVAGALLDRTLSAAGTPAASQDRRDSDRDRRQRYLDWLAAELALSEQQREQVAAVLERNREEVASLWEETRPAFEELKNRLRAEVRDVLSEQQQVAYDSLIATERDRHRRRR